MDEWWCLSSLLPCVGTCESKHKGNNKEQTSMNHIKPTAVDKQYLAVQAFTMTHSVQAGYKNGPYVIYSCYKIINHFSHLEFRQPID